MLHSKRSLFQTNGLLLLLFLSTMSSWAQSPKISINSNQLPDFRQVYTGMYSDVQFYYLSAQSLTAPLKITAQAPFKISLHCYEDFQQELELQPTNGQMASTRIYVRFYPDAAAAFTRIISHESGNLQGPSLGLSGTGINPSIPLGYYSNATATGVQLKTQLHNIIREHQVQTYSSLWTHFVSTDSNFNGKVWDIYSHEPCKEPPYEYTFGEDQDVGSGGNKENDFYNREHSMPRSWFGGAVDPMNTDLFHIYPVDKWVNAQRGDDPYGEVQSPSWTSKNGGKLGPNAYGSTYSGNAFEPIDSYKGDLARSYFYMITRYQDVSAQWPKDKSGQYMFDYQQYPGYQSWAIDMLLQWHRQDPVSQKEIMRNNAIYQIQGNRNPFIDYPVFVERIWGDPTTNTPQASTTTKPRVFPNPANDLLHYQLTQTGGNLHIYNLAGQQMLSVQLDQLQNTISLNMLQAGMYILHFEQPHDHSVLKLVVNNKP